MHHPPLPTGQTLPFYGPGAPRTSVPAYCCHNRCLQHRLGRYMQRAGSPGSLDRARLLWHINCLELWAVHLALRQFRPLLLGKHVLVRTDNTAAVSYINRLGGIRSHRMSQLTRHLLLWSHSSSSHCVLFTSWGSSIVRPTRSYDSSRSPESGDSIPRRSG